MPDYPIPILPEILDYAKFLYPIMVPNNRIQGYEEPEGVPRGEGFQMELVARLTIFHHLGRHEKACSMLYTSGKGDQGDIEIFIDNRTTIWNVKTSKFTPFSDKLNLMVKAYELNHKMTGYLATLTHMKDDHSPNPHIHVCGWCYENSNLFQEAKKHIVELPLNHQKGIMIPFGKLTPFERLRDSADKKF